MKIGIYARGLSEKTGGSKEYIKWAGTPKLRHGVNMV